MQHGSDGKYKINHSLMDPNRQSRDTVPSIRSIVRVAGKMQPIRNDVQNIAPLNTE